MWPMYENPQFQKCRNFPYWESWCLVWGFVLVRNFQALIKLSRSLQDVFQVSLLWNKLRPKLLAQVN